MSGNELTRHTGDPRKTRLWNIPVPLRASDPSSPSLPAWGAFALCGVVVLPAVGLIAVLFNQVFAAWAAGGLALLCIPMLGVLIVRRSKPTIKKVKYGLDALWNAWTFAAVTFAASAAIGGLKFEEALTSLSGHWLGSLLMVLAVTTAAGRVAMPFVEAWTDRPGKASAADASTVKPPDDQKRN